MSQDRAIQPDDIVAVAHCHLPPILLEIIFKLDPKRAVIPHPVEPAINLARLENEPAPLAQTDDFLHSLRILVPCHDRKYLTADHADETDFYVGCRQNRLSQSAPHNYSTPAFVAAVYDRRLLIYGRGAHVLLAKSLYGHFSAVIANCEASKLLF